MVAFGPRVSNPNGALALADYNTASNQVKSFGRLARLLKTLGRTDYYVLFTAELSKLIETANRVRDWNGDE